MGRDEDILNSLDWEIEEPEFLQYPTIIDLIDSRLPALEKCKKSILIVSQKNFQIIYDHVCHDERYLHHAIDIIQSLFCSDDSFMLICVEAK